MKQLLTLLAALLLVGGCASPYSKYQQALARGDCAAAESFMQPAAQRSDPAAVNNIGVVYQSCYQNTQTAVAYYTLAARMGDGNARMNLTRLGQPVPAADLVRQSSGNNAAANAAAMAYSLELLRNSQRQPQQAPQQQLPPIRSTNCTSQRVGDFVYTNCY